MSAKHVTPEQGWQPGNSTRSAETSTATLAEALATDLAPAQLRWWHQGWALRAVFLAAHIYMLSHIIPVVLMGRALEDMNLYHKWTELGFNDGHWVGVDEPWVYPFLAITPMGLAALGGGGAAGFQIWWFVIFMALNAGAVLLLTNRGRRRKAYPAAYWWLIFTAVMSYVAVARIDGISAPLALMGAVLVATSPAWAATLLAVATWIKVWPAGIIAALLTVSRKRLRILAAGFAVSAGVVLWLLWLGNAGYVFSFMSEQTERGMQLEAPFSTPGLWQVMLGIGDARVEYNFDIITQEINGGASDFVSAVLTPVMVVMMLLLVALIWLAKHRGADRVDVALTGAQAIITALVLFNKVGSPQFMLWLAPVIAVGLAIRPQAWRVGAVLVLTIGLLTAVMYPYLYVGVMQAKFGPVMLITGRNVLIVVLFIWICYRLWTLLPTVDAGAAEPEKVHDRA